SPPQKARERVFEKKISKNENNLSAIDLSCVTKNNHHNLS
ncbi:MAG: hypothetical protein ACI90V_012914, partial [Bacillariaceae sp.]